MREKKFRGKRVDNGEWVYGFYRQYPIYKPCGTCIDHINHFIDFDCFSEFVDPETVGQYTGLKDKDCKEAWEGDIFTDSKGVIRTIFWGEGGFRAEANPLSFGYGYQDNANPSMVFSDYLTYSEPLADQQNASWFTATCEIIGNIHDHPELIKPKK